MVTDDRQVVRSRDLTLFCLAPRPPAVCTAFMFAAASANAHSLECTTKRS